MKSKMDEDCLIFPPKPEKPLASDCCGNGCIPCVLDIYQEELAMWEAECARIKSGEVLGFSTSKDGGEGLSESELYKLEKENYNGFTISAINQETKDTLRLRFALHKTHSLGLAVGEHVIIRAATSSGSLFTRQYTPVSPVQSKGYFEFLLKVYPSGQMSNILKSWQVGDKINMRGPIGNFKYIPNKHRKVLMLCAGTGIAPMCQVIHAILDNENDDTLIRLAYACKNYTEVLAKAELSEWRRYWNFSSVFVLSQEPQDPEYSYGYGEEIIKGHVDETFVRQELGHHLDKMFVMICGTRSFDSDMLGYARKLGVPEGSIHKF